MKESVLLHRWSQTQGLESADLESGNRSADFPNRSADFPNHCALAISIFERF